MAMDRTQYIFNGTQYGKSRLVLAVVRKYCNDKKPDLSEVERVFPSSISESIGVVISDEKFELMKHQNDDIVKRFCSEHGDSILLEDGNTIYVSNQWRITNITKFISTAANLGFKIETLNETKITVGSLYEIYKRDPNSDWIDSYRERCDQLSAYKDKPAELFDTELLSDIWKIPNNGITGVGAGALSNDEFSKLLDDLPKITRKILSTPTPEMLDEVMDWVKSAKEEGRYSSMKRIVIRRVFCAASPETYCTIMRGQAMTALIAELNNRFNLGINTQGNWAQLNINLMRAIKAQGLQDEDIFFLNTFAWDLYEQLANKSNQKIEDLVTERNSCKNVIYYGPPGTGKTYTLQQLLKQSYTEQETQQDREIWLRNQIGRFSWFEVIVLILLQLDKPLRVEEIISHNYYQIKSDFNERSGNLRATAWSSLQSHAVSESVTVNSTRRIEPLVFDKTENSLWYIAEGSKELVEEYIVLLSQLDAGPVEMETIKRFEFITFHQSYGYEEFIEGLRPVVNSSGDISYEVRQGVFKRICQLAKSDPTHQYAIVIDEINRGNISKIFGELITLIELDKRNGSENALTATLPYSGSPFSVPSNLDVIGSMNTADRSLSHIDVALRRRFDFVELRTNYMLLSENMEGINIRKMLYAINQRIELLLDREHIIGHALLMKVSSLVELNHAFSTSILPLLEEYFFENWAKIKQVLNDNGFIEEQMDAAETWLGDRDEYSERYFQINSSNLTVRENYILIYTGIRDSVFDFE